MEVCIPKQEQLAHQSCDIEPLKLRCCLASPRHGLRAAWGVALLLSGVAAGSAEQVSVDEAVCPGIVHSTRPCLLQDVARTRKVVVDTFVAHEFDSEASGSDSRSPTFDSLHAFPSPSSPSSSLRSDSGSRGNSSSFPSSALELWQATWSWAATELTTMTGRVASQIASLLDKHHPPPLASLLASPQTHSAGPMRSHMGVPFMLLAVFGAIAAVLLVVLMIILSESCAGKWREGESSEIASAWNSLVASLPFSGKGDDHRSSRRDTANMSLMSTASLVPAQHCCPELLVPDDTECILLVPLVDMREQKVDLVDTNGNLVLTAFAQRPSSGSRRITLQTANGEVMAHASVDASRYRIMQANGEVFAVLTKMNGEYLLKTRTGGRYLFWGDLDTRTTNISDMATDEPTKRHFEDLLRGAPQQQEVRTTTPAGSVLVATTEPSAQGTGPESWRTSETKSYMLRVGPGMDVGLLACSLLAVDHL